eukprot:scaffold45452_cov336-Skeletonema_marinoi.AAC.1
MIAGEHKSPGLVRRSANRYQTEECVRELKYIWIESSRPCSKEVMTRIFTPCQGRNRIQRRCEHRCKIERKGRKAGRVGLKKKY